MKRKTLFHYLPFILLASALILTSCGTRPAPEDILQPTVTTSTHPELGEYLVDSQGMTLYIYTLDDPDESRCFGACAQAWPPLQTTENPVAGEGVDPQLLGTGLLTNSELVVTYARMPLYYHINDEEPGDITGQGLENAFYMVAPDGEPIGF